MNIPNDFGKNYDEKTIHFVLSQFGLYKTLSWSDVKNDYARPTITLVINLTLEKY